MRWRRLGLGLCLIAHVASVHPAFAATQNVNCTAGETITQALANAEQGDTILVEGSCSEQVVITTNGLTLDGQETAVLNGGEGGTVDTSEGVITVNHARDVTITGFTLQHGSDGITCQRGASCMIHNSSLLDHADDGVQVSQNATAILSDITILRSGSEGIDVRESSSVELRGVVVSNDNQSDGLRVSLASSALQVEGELQLNNNRQRGLFAVMTSSLFLRGAMVETSNNAAHGVLILTGSNITLGNPTLSFNTTGNGQDGILLNNTGNLNAVTGTLNANGNGRYGINVLGRGSVVIVAAMAQLTNNQRGLNIEAQSLAATDLLGNLSSQNNSETGISVSDNSTLRLTGTATVINNPTDIDLTFGSTAVLAGSHMIGAIACDTTVLSQGTVGCP